MAIPASIRAAAPMDSPSINGKFLFGAVSEIFAQVIADIMGFPVTEVILTVISFSPPPLGTVKDLKGKVHLSRRNAKYSPKIQIPGLRWHIRY